MELKPVFHFLSLLGKVDKEWEIAGQRVDNIIMISFQKKNTVKCKIIYHKFI